MLEKEHAADVSVGSNVMAAAFEDPNAYGYGAVDNDLYYATTSGT